MISARRFELGGRLTPAGLLRAGLKTPVGNTELGSSVNPRARMPALRRSAGILACGFGRHPCRQFRVFKPALSGWPETGGRPSSSSSFSFSSANFPFLSRTRTRTKTKSCVSGQPLVWRHSRFVTSRGSGSSCRQVGRVTPCAPQMGSASPPNGAHGVTRPTKQAAKLFCHSTSYQCPRRRGMREAAQSDPPK